MNFKILPLLVAAAIGTNVQAQTPTALMSMSSTTNNSTARTLVDSIVYNYSGGRGGVPIVDNWLISRRADTYRPTSDVINYINKDYKVMLGHLSFDTAKNLKTSTMRSIAFFDKEYNTYNGVGLLTKQEQYVDVGSHKNEYFNNIPGVVRIVTNYSYYSTGNLMTKTVVCYDAGGAVLSNKKDSFAYSSSGMPVYLNLNTSISGYSEVLNYYYVGGLLDSIDQGLISKKFHYSGTNLIRYRYHYGAIAEENTYYTYNTAGQLLQDSSTSTDIYWNISPTQKNTYVYNTQNDIVELTTDSWNKAGTGSWTGWRNKDFAVYDGNHNLLSIYHETNAGTPYSYKDMKYNYAYNSSNLLSTFSIQMWDPATSSWTSANSDTIRHYYYGNATGVNKVPATQLHCSIYPVPATAMLNIDISNGKENETAFEVFNTSGQLVRRMVVKTQANGKYTIPVADLSAGTYILHCKNGEMENVKQFAVLR